MFNDNLIEGINKSNKEIENIQQDRLSFRENELLRNIKDKNQKIKYISEAKMDDFLKDIWNQLQNIAKQAKSECIHQKNKRIMKYKEGEKIPKEIEKEIRYYKKEEGKWKRLEQECIWWWKKRSIQYLINGNLFKNLINTPQNNRFQYTSKTSKKIYDVIILNKNIVGGKIIYEVETISQWGKKIHPIKFATSTEHNKEEDIFSPSNTIKQIESLKEIKELVMNFLKNINR